jgi:hypothetical protein
MRGLKSFGATVLMFIILPFAQGRAAEYHGAIAIWLGDDHMSWGWAWNYPTQSGANRNALAQCGNRDCEVVLQFWNGACGALATVGNSNGMAWGAAWRNSRSGAEAAALRACTSSGIGDCQIAVSVCTSRP